MVVEKENYLQLLNELYKNSRKSIKNISNQMNLSRQTVSKMKNNLWEKGIIDRPTVLLNPTVLNLEIYFMEIKTNPSEPKILQKLSNLEEVDLIDGVLGDYSLIIKFIINSKKRFSEILQLIDDEIAQTMFQSYKLIEIIEPYKMGGVIINKDMDPKIPSELDWNIIKILKKNNNYRKWKPREDKEIDNSELSQEEQDLLESINLSRKTQKFINKGMIQRYTISLYYKYLKDKNLNTEFQSKYYLRIKPKKIGNYKKLAEQLVKEPNIIELYRTGEDFGLLAMIRTNGLEGYNTFIKNLYKNYEIFDTHTTVSIESHMAEIAPPTMDISAFISGIKKYDS